MLQRRESRRGSGGDAWCFSCTFAAAQLLVIIFLSYYLNCLQVQGRKMNPAILNLIMNVNLLDKVTAKTH